MPVGTEIARQGVKINYHFYLTASVSVVICTMNEQSIEILKAATADIRADYVARYTELEMATLVRDRAGLVAMGMDASVYAPYPTGRMAKDAYLQAESKYRRVRFSFRGVKGYRCMNEPEIVVEREDAEPRRRAAAKAEADAQVDSYLFKMAAKIGKDIASASTNGCIWDFATLKVVCVDGEEQTWKTNCILNQSVYGKLFNQWPTRRVS